MINGLVAQVPGDFQFGFKVTDEITVKRFPNLSRFGNRAGQPNVNFLNSDLFERAFLGPCQAFRSQVGVIMFEFSRFHSADYTHGADFVADLDRFLGSLPAGWPYAIELRNRHWLTPEYFECLRRHGVAHVFNPWSGMPPVQDQIALPGTVPTPQLVAARFLLAPGRTYEAAVKAFQPYRETKAVNEATRRSGRQLIQDGRAIPGRKTFIFVNNRLEGNALETIAAMLEDPV